MLIEIPVTPRTIIYTTVFIIYWYQILKQHLTASSYVHPIRYFNCWPECNIQPNANDVFYYRDIYMHPTLYVA